MTQPTKVQPGALEALTEFLYIAPVGLVQFGMDGAIQIANALAVQLLLPLAPSETLENAFTALSPLVPDLADKVLAYKAPSGIILDHLRCDVTCGARSSVLSVTIHRVLRDNNLIVLEDVTLLAERERELHADRQRFQAIFDNVRDYAIYTVDRLGVIDEWNPSLYRLGGWLAEDVTQRTLDMFFTEDDRASGQMHRMLRSARSAGSVETEGWRIHRDGGRFWANTVLTALPDETGAVRSFVAVSRDMTERKRMEDELRRLSATDPLTGALNRRSGQALLEEAFRAHYADDRRPGIVIFDIDHFKAINDQHGHGAGDRALCKLVNVCRDFLKQRGALVRWGGEEFLIVLASTTQDEALALAEELRAVVETAGIETRAGKITMTASFGVAVGGSDPDEMLRRADTALYAAKDGGRNRAVLSA